jgi:GTP cyclohydrolase I
MKKLNLISEAPKLAARLKDIIIQRFGRTPKKIFFVPTAGHKVAWLLEMVGLKFITVYNQHDAEIIIDDIIDSGETFNNYNCNHLHPFLALISKNELHKDRAIYYAPSNTWVELFEEDNNIMRNLKRVLQYIGENPEREGLIDTPKRMVASYEKLFGGYKYTEEHIKKLLSTTFSETCDEMVLLKNSEFYSTCEHHFLPFFGQLHIAYIPNKKVVGVSKLARLSEIFARRLQIQERMVNQITDNLQKYLKPKGVMVVAEAQHFCMTSRGVEKQNSIMVTSSMRGAFKQAAVRQEFFNLIGGKK